MDLMVEVLSGILLMALEVTSLHYSLGSKGKPKQLRTVLGKK